MNFTENIRNKQNSEEMLRNLFASRKLFNIAEKINYVIWILILISGSSILYSNKLSEKFCIIFLLVLDAITALLCILYSYSITNAADIRKHFDANVLEIMDYHICEQKLSVLKEKTNNICNFFAKEYQIQITHTGNDNPPGVKEWYNIPESNSLEDIQISCLSQNTWWTKKLFITRMIVTFSFLVILFILWLCFAFCMIHTTPVIIFLSSPILLRVIERVYENIKYYIQIVKTENALDYVSTSKDSDLIYIYFNNITDIRYLKITGLNFLHKLLSNNLEKKYSESH